MNLLSNRIQNLIRQNAGIISAGCDDEINSKYGVWVSPYLSQANQGLIEGVEGYKSRSKGWIIGTDTTINDDLTTIGLAVSRTRADVKLTDYLRGDKSKITNWGFSIYGLQQLKSSWFVEGIIMYSTARIKSRKPRFEFGEYKTALSSYKYRSWRGEALLGYNALY
ncbi:MAG: autotransporter outer membrane beta-barrel domain-containing protein [Candidatus Rickettsia vulgarisii]